MAVVEDKGLGMKVFKIFNYIFLFFLAFICLFPILHILAISLSDRASVAANQVVLIPQGFHTAAYRQILQSTGFIRAFITSVFRVIIGTSINITLIILAAYPLSKKKKNFKGRNVFMWFFIFPMLFSGGMIPTYLLIRELGLINSYWALVFNQSLVQIFSIIILMSFFRNLPDSLFEAALIDGASHWKILYMIAIPLSKAAIATVTLFAMVMHWNEWFLAMIYLNDASKFPLQTYLQQLLQTVDYQTFSRGNIEMLRLITNRSFIAAQIFVSMIPVLCVYPFLQKYFVKGITLGAVKE